MKYGEVGKKVNQFALADIIMPYPDKLIKLPQLLDKSGEEFRLDTRHDLSEDDVQNMVNNSFVGSKIRAEFYACDTHKTKTFLGKDLMPDIMVSFENRNEILGDFEVAFRIELKSEKWICVLLNIWAKLQFTERVFLSSSNLIFALIT